MIQKNPDDLVRVLVIDDDPRVQKDLRYILSRNQYSVKTALGKGKKLIENAKILGRDFRPHIAVIDVNLFRDSVNDRSGVSLLEHLKSARCIFYSAYLNPELTREIIQLNPFSTWVEKTESPQKLLDIIKGLSKDVSASERQASLYVISGWNQTVIERLIGKETNAPATLVNDLVIQLFPGSREISLEELDQSITTPQAVSRGRSIIMKVSHDSRIASNIIKIAAADTIRNEVKNYKEYIEENLLGRFHSTISGSPVLFWDLGAVLYTLIEHPQEQLTSFRKFFEEQGDSEIILKPLSHFFTSTWAGLYKKAVPSDEKLSDFYERTFHWSNRLKEYPNKDNQLSIPGLNLKLLNPISWLLKHNQDSSVINFRQSITHGDLHADNIIVNANYAWAIDFERSGIGHSLRDFIELEVDIFTRLIEETSNREVNIKELFLMGMILANSSDPFLNNQLCRRLSNPKLVKALNVIREVRLICIQLTQLSDFREYLWGLLFDLTFLATLAEENKVQRERALLFGAIVCQRIKDGISDTWPPTAWLSVFDSIPAMPDPILNNVSSSSKPPFPSSTFSPATNNKKRVSRPILAISMVIIMMAIVLGVLWGVTIINPSPLVLTITIILLLPLVIIFSFVVSGLARGDDSLKVIRDIVLGGIRRFISSDRDKETSDEDLPKK